MISSVCVFVFYVQYLSTLMKAASFYNRWRLTQRLKIGQHIKHMEYLAVSGNIHITPLPLQYSRIIVEAG